MKMIAALLVSVFAFNVNADVLVSKVYALDAEVDVKAEVQKMYNEEMAKENSPLKSAVNEFLVANEAVLEWNGNSPVYSVNFEELIYVYSGKSGAAYGGSSALLGLWLGFPGTGAIEQLSGWLKVNSDYNFEKETFTVSIEKLIPFSIE